MLPKKYRLRLKKDFDRIFKEGRFAGGRFFTLGYLKNNMDFSRFAVVVAKKVDKRAVRRNLIRRRTSEIIRLGQEKIKTGFDLVFIAKPAVLDKSYKEIEDDIIILLDKAKMV
jgi:ribonuclease P protein component